MAKQQPTNKPPTHKGLPDPEVFIEAAKNWPQVLVKVRRQSGKGHWAMVCGGVLMTIKELANIEDWIAKSGAGGGMFRIEPKNPANEVEYAWPGVPPFTLEIEGILQS